MYAVHLVDRRRKSRSENVKTQGGLVGDPTKCQSFPERGPLGLSKDSNGITI